jgi:hypothetical protein
VRGAFRNRTSPCPLFRPPGLRSLGRLPVKTRLCIWLGFLVASGCFLFTHLSLLGCQYAFLYGLSKGVGGGHPPEWSEVILRTYGGGFGVMGCVVLVGMLLVYELPAMALWLFCFSRVFQCLVWRGLGALTLANISVFSKTYLAQQYCQTACTEIEIIALLQLTFGFVSLLVAPIIALVECRWRARHSSGITEITRHFGS